MPAVKQYEDERGRRPFERWFDGLPTAAALKVRTALAKLEGGNTSALKSVGKGVHEAVIDFGPGYRVYIGQDGADLVILLGGSTKARQQQATAEAQGCWADYKVRKRRGG